MQAKEHKVLDRAAMIEAASRSLRQQMRVRDRPRSKGSLHDMRDIRDPGAIADAPPQETSQRRIHSAENKYRMMSSQRDGAENNQSASSSALDSYPAEEEPASGGTSTQGTQEVPPLGELKRPMSRKKVPSASAAAGLGACLNPVKMTDAFEQRKTRQPIPVESWGPRPPSRHRLPPNATLLDVSLLSSAGDEERVEPKLIASGASRSRSEPGQRGSDGRPGSKAGSDSVVSTKWAAARYPGPLGVQHHSASGLSEPRRGRKTSQRDWGATEDLGIFGVSGLSAARSPNGQQLTKSLSGVFDHHSSEFRDAMASRQASTNSWAAHVDTSGTLEVSGHSALGDRADLWMVSAGPHTLPLRKSRHPDAVSVEDVEADQDLGLRSNTFRRDVQPQVIITRSTLQKKDRIDVRRARDDRLARGRSTPFGTSLDANFLSLFAL